jgi:hypothetical protein
MATVTTSQQSMIDPTIRPYLEQGLSAARNLFMGGFQPQLYPGQMYVSPSEQTLAGLSQQEALARQANPSLQAAQEAYQQALGGTSFTAQGGFLNANPTKDDGSGYSPIDPTVYPRCIARHIEPLQPIWSIR